MRLRRPPGRRWLDEVTGLYWDSGVGDDVPALAWYLVSSLVPLALGLTALATVILGDWAEAQALAERASQVLPSDVHARVVELILRTHRDSPWLIAGSIIAMVWTSSGAVGVIARCLSRLLALPDQGPVRGRLRHLVVAGGLAIVIVLMVLAASAGTGIVRRLEIDPLVIRVLVPLASATVSAAVCSAMYWTLARGSVRWGAALLGGSIGALVLQATPTAAGYYLRYVAGAAPVELFLMLAGVLITCYLAALGLLLGAGVVARSQLGHRLGTGEIRTP